MRLAEEEDARRERSAAGIAANPTMVPSLRFGREIMEPLQAEIETLREEISEAETELDAHLQTPREYDDERAAEIAARLTQLKARADRLGRRYTLLKIFEDESPRGGPTAGYVVFRLTPREREILGLEGV